MNEDILKKLQGIPVPQDVPLEGLNILLKSLNQKETEKKPDLSKEFSFLKLLGVENPENVNIKYLGILVSGWIEVRSKNEIHIEESEVADTTGGDLEKKLESYEKELERTKSVREKIKKDTADTLNRKQKIVDEQKRIQEELRKAKEAEEKVKGKKIYASVEIKNKYQANEETNEKYEALKNESVDSLAKKIEDQLSDGSLQTEDQREKKVLARSIAVGIIAQVANPNLEHTINSKVLQTVGESNIFENLIEKDLIDTAKNGAISIAINERSQIALGRRAVSHLYGEDVSEMLFGPEDIVVTLTIEQQQNSSHEIDTGAVNSNYEILLTKQSEALDEVNRSSNPESTIITRVASFTREKEEKIEGKVKKLSETEKIKTIIKKFSLNKPSKSLLITEIDVNPWVESVLNKKTLLSVAIEQTTATNIASPIEQTTATSIASPIEQTTATSIASPMVSVISKTLLKTAGKEIATKIGVKEAITVVLGGLNPLQTALVRLGTELISKISQWIKKNPEAAALIFGGLAFLGTLPLFGPLIALGITSVVVAATIGVGVTTAAVLGTLNLVRFVWSRIVVSLAGPMFVVFVVIPILTAFTLFIINSGAYVVPLGGLDSPGGIGVPTGGTIIDIDCDSIDESLPPTAFAAELIVCSLNELKLNPLFSTMVGNSNWQQLTTVLNSVAIAELQRSANVEGCWNGVCSKHLQCVGFVEASAGQAYGSAFDHKNACDYIGTNIGGYRYIAGTQGMKSGDFFLINGRPCSSNSPGHIGVVISIDGVSITCADANAIGPGKVRVAKGCYVLSQITGYLRKN